MSAEHDYKHSHEEDNGLPVFTLIGFVLGVLSLFVAIPTIIFLVFYYWFIYKGLRWKPKYTSIVYLSILSILAIFWVVSPPTTFLDDSVNVVKGLFNGGNVDFSIIIGPIILVSMTLSTIISFIHTISLQKAIINDPYLTEAKGRYYKYSFRRSIFEILKINKLRKELQNGEAYSTEAVPLGLLAAPVEVEVSGRNGIKKIYDEPSIVYAYYKESALSTMVFGASGSGKTISAINRVRNDVYANLPVIVLDFKKGLDWAYHLDKLAKETGRQFLHFSKYEEKYEYSEKLVFYDPLSTGTADGKADFLLNIRKWDAASDTYKQRMKTVLTNTYRLLEYSRHNPYEFKDIISWERGGLSAILSALEPAALNQMAEWYEEQMIINGKESESQESLNNIKFFVRDINNTKSKTYLQLEEIKSVLGNIVNSGYGRQFIKRKNKAYIDLPKVILNNSDIPPIVLFQFNPLEEREVAESMGTIVFKDILRTVAELENIGSKKPWSLNVDEFQTLDPADIGAFVEKARSVGCRAIFATQSPEKLAEKAGRESLDTILDAVGNFMIHPGIKGKSATMLSEIFGSTQAVKASVVNSNHTGVFSINFKNNRDSKITKTVEDVPKITERNITSLESPTEINGYRAEAWYVPRASNNPEITFKGAVGGFIPQKVECVVDSVVLEDVSPEYRAMRLKERKKTIDKKSVKKTQIDALYKSDPGVILEEIKEKKEKRKKPPVLKKTRPPITPKVQQAGKVLPKRPLPHHGSEHITSVPIEKDRRKVSSLKQPVSDNKNIIGKDTPQKMKSKIQGMPIKNQTPQKKSQDITVDDLKAMWD